MSLLSVTRLKLKSPRYLPAFLINTERIAREIRTSEGFLQGQLMGTFNLSMWTMTLWNSEATLKKFYLSGTHQKIMGKLSEWSSEAASVHMEVNNHQLLIWNDVIAEICRTGYFATLQEPSLDHRNRIIQKPNLILKTIFLSPKNK